MVEKERMMGRIDELEKKLEGRRRRGVRKK